MGCLGVWIEFAFALVKIVLVTGVTGLVRLVTGLNFKSRGGWDWLTESVFSIGHGTTGVTGQNYLYI